MRYTARHLAVELLVHRIISLTLLEARNEPANRLWIWEDKARNRITDVLTNAEVRFKTVDVKLRPINHEGIYKMEVLVV